MSSNNKEKPLQRPIELSDVKLKLKHLEKRVERLMKKIRDYSVKTALQP